MPRVEERPKGPFTCFTTYLTFIIMLLDILLSFGLDSHVWHTKFLFGGIRKQSWMRSGPGRVASDWLLFTRPRHGNVDPLLQSHHQQTGRGNTAHFRGCSETGNGRLTLLEKYVFVSVTFILLGWMKCGSQMFGERQTSAAQTHKCLGRDEEEGLP